MSEIYKQRLIDIYGEDIVIKFLQLNSAEEIYEMFYGNLLVDSLYGRISIRQYGCF